MGVGHVFSDTYGYTFFHCGAVGLVRDVVGNGEGL